MFLKDILLRSLNFKTAVKHSQAEQGLHDWLMLLIFCMLGNFACFWLSAGIFKIKVFK